MHDLLDRLLLSNQVTTTLPQINRNTNQKLVITDLPRPLLNCYLEENPGDLSARLLNMVAGTTLMLRLNYNAYYQNSRCLVAYLGIPVTLDSDKNTVSAALLSEMLVRAVFNDQIKVNKNKRPVDTINIKSDEFFDLYKARGTYKSETDTIELQQGYYLIFETITHELLHSFATIHDSWLGYPQSGLNEAITQYNTEKILRNIPDYSRFYYEEQVIAFEALLKIIDEKTLLDVYFNGDFRSLQKQVDSKTYPGAYCRFNHYLDKSLVEYNDTHNFELSKELTLKAVKALVVNEADDLNCK